MTSSGVRYCWPRLSPPALSCTPGVIWTNWGSLTKHDKLMNPMTKSLWACAMSAAAFVYSPVANVPLELISPISRHAFPSGKPTSLRPLITPSPGTTCALTRSAHSAIWYNPLEYWFLTVLPISANFLSSKIKTLCFAASIWSDLANSGVKSSRMSTCVFTMQTWGPILSTRLKTLSQLVKSTETARFDFLICITSNNFLVTELLAICALASKLSLLPSLAGTLATAAGVNVFVDRNSLTFPAISWPTFPFAKSTSRTSGSVRRLWSLTPWNCSISFPPWKRSNKTTASETTNSTEARASTVSRTLDPLVTTSSITKQLLFGVKTPSISLFVPYDLASFLLITIGTFWPTEIADAIGKAV